jgi:ribonucleotide reductase alpha subunit
MHKETKEDWEWVVDQMFEYKNPKTGEVSPLISEECHKIIKENIEFFQSKLQFERDYCYDFFGFKTLERSYLVKVNGKIVERPQHMLMRVAVGIHKTDIASAVESYELMSQSFFTHATPTLFNAGTPIPQMSSCFLLTMKEDSIDGIYSTLKNCALISKSAGG